MMVWQTKNKNQSPTNNLFGKANKANTHPLKNEEKSLISDITKTFVWYAFIKDVL